MVREAREKKGRQRSLWVAKNIMPWCGFGLGLDMAVVHSMEWRRYLERIQIRARLDDSLGNCTGALGLGNDRVFDVIEHGEIKGCCTLEIQIGGKIEILSVFMGFR